MQENCGFASVEEAFFSMSDEAARKYIEIGQMMAEMFPNGKVYERASNEAMRNRVLVLPVMQPMSA
jgi:hypothetical protein